MYYDFRDDYTHHLDYDFLSESILYNKDDDYNFDTDHRVH